MEAREWKILGECNKIMMMHTVRCAVKETVVTFYAHGILTLSAFVLNCVFLWVPCKIRAM